MSWTVVPLVRIACAIGASLALAACVDPHGDYDDFLARPVAEPMHDAAAPPKSRLPRANVAPENPSGDYYVTCLPTIIPTPFGLALHQEITVGDGGKGQIKSSFQMLDIHGTNIKDLVGEPVDNLPSTSINANCTYDLDIGNLTIPEKATTLGGEAKAEHVKLHALLNPTMSHAQSSTDRS